MSGTLIFKPMEAKLTHDTDLFSKMDPYCTILLSEQKVAGKVCNGGGKHPKWADDNLVVQRNGEAVCFIELKDKDTFSKDDVIGVAQVDPKSKIVTTGNYVPMQVSTQDRALYMISCTYQYFCRLAKRRRSMPNRMFAHPSSISP